MTEKYILLAILWTGYCVVHSILAATSFKQRVQLLFGKNYKYYRLFYNLYAVATLVIVILYQLSFTSAELFHPVLITKIAGIIIMLTGLVIMSICIYNYFLQESGLLWLNPDETKRKNELIVTGIHKKVRHPLYLGTFIFVWGILVFFPTVSMLIADSIITIYTLIAIQFEENKLIKEYGEIYKEYKRKVPMIIPRF